MAESGLTPLDPRMYDLSYSSMTTLHTCPRRFQLYRLSSQKDDAPEGDTSPITFAYGHAVGAGIQSVLQEKTEEEVIFDTFMAWDTDFLDDHPKKRKSFPQALTAVQKFRSLRANGYLNDWELVYYEGKPAVELSFRITFPDGFRYRGSVDAVLRHRVSGEIMVLECKTTGFSNVNPASYKNSAQAIGYSIILDAIFPGLSSYQVLYLVYKSISREYEPLEFKKSLTQRALWIRELMLDIESIKMYEDAGIYPMRGENCYSFFRECEYLTLCTLNTANITDAYDPEKHKDDKVYDVELTLMDLVNSQLEKV